MEITEVRIKLMEGAQDRLLGFCSITFDRAFVVRDMKIIKGSRGAFVAMPSRKLTDRCPACSHKNPLRSAFCSQCGVQLAENRSPKSSEGKAKLYADIAHPINSECRDMIQQHVLLAYDEELILAQQPGYVSRYDDFGEFELDSEESENWEEEESRPQSHSPAIASIEPGQAEKVAQQRRWDVRQSSPSRAPHNPAAEGRQKETVPHHAENSSDAFGDGLF